MAMDRDAQHWAQFYGFLAGVLLVLGVLLQDWGTGFRGLQIGTMFPGWGVYVMQYILCAQAISFAMHPLGPKAGKRLDGLHQWGFGALAVAALLRGVHSEFFVGEASLVGDIVDTLSHVLLMCGWSLVALVATMASTRGGHLHWLPSDRVLVYIFVGAAAFLSAAFVVFARLRVPSSERFLPLVERLFAASWLTLVAASSAELALVAILFASFVAALLVAEVGLEPWHSSLVWNEMALSSSIDMVHTLATFVLIVQLVSNVAALPVMMSAVSAAEQEGKVLLDKLDKRRCCDFSHTGGWLSGSP